MDDERTSTPAAVESLPMEARAAAYIGAEQRLEHRLELPGA